MIEIIYIHITLIVIFIILILLKYGTESNFTFAIYLFLLTSQLTLLHLELEQKKQENFKDNITMQSFDAGGLQKLVELPNKMTQPISSGLDLMIENTSGKTEYSNIYSNMKNYKDINRRKEYKHIDYLLEKIKVLDKNIYATLIPNYSKEEYEKNADLMDKMDE
jgi:hypothetical protein